MRPNSSRPQLEQIGGRALTEVLDTLLSLQAEAVNRKDQADTREATPDLWATVLLTGQKISGEVHVQISESFARKATGLLLGSRGTEWVDETATQDFAEELCNMIAGRVAKRLGEADYPCTLGTPRFGRVAAWKWQPEAGADFSKTEWSCHGDPLTLVIQCRYRPN